MQVTVSNEGANVVEHTERFVVTVTNQTSAVVWPGYILRVGTSVPLSLEAFIGRQLLACKTPCSTASIGPYSCYGCPYKAIGLAWA